VALFQNVTVKCTYFVNNYDCGNLIFFASISIFSDSSIIKSKIHVYLLSTFISILILWL